MFTMRDSDVRGAVKDWLGAQYAHDPHTRIVEEMGIWSGSVRVDIAVINGELQGFELKSERDTLARLENQAELYNQVFDRVTLVTAKRHIDKAASIIPRWWGVACATMQPDGPLTLRTIRRARKNPNVEPIQLARLLWRAEALAILEKRGLSRGFKSRTAEIIAERLIQVLSLAELSTEVREMLKSRPGWLGQAVGDQRDMAARGVACPLGSASGAGRSASNILNLTVSPTSD